MGCVSSAETLSLISFLSCACLKEKAACWALKSANEVGLVEEQEMTDCNLGGRMAWWVACRAVSGEDLNSIGSLGGSRVNSIRSLLSP